MVFGFWDEDFSRKFSAGFLRLQSASLRERFEILLQILFFQFWFFGVMFFWTFGGTFTGGLLKLLFYVLTENLRWITSKTLNMFQKLWILIEIFSYFDESFPAALCKVHSKCPEEHLEGILSLKTPGISS